MFVDALGLLSDAQALTATANSTNTIDFGSVTRDPFAGEPMAVALGVDVVADFTTGNETYVVEAVISAAAALTSPIGLGAVTIAAGRLVAGAMFTFPLMPVVPLSSMLRYFGLVYTLGGTTPTITVTAWLTAQSMIDRYRQYAKGYTVS